MSRLLISLAVFFLTSCHPERIFYWTNVKNADKPGTTSITVDPNDYTLYIREICITNNLPPYQDCPPGPIVSPNKKMEIEYLFISNKTNQVIYLSTFSDKYESLYSRQGFDHTSTVNINAWYLSKVYIGTLDRATNTITFRTKKDEQLLVGMIISESDIYFKEVTEKKGSHKETQRSIDGSLAPVPHFAKMPGFQWVITSYLPDANINNQVPPVMIKDNAFLVRKNAGIYFKLSAKWGNHKQEAIRYRYNRLATQQF